MSFAILRRGNLLKYAVCVSLAACAMLVSGSPQRSAAQEPKAAPVQAPTAAGGDVARGKYIVEDVAMCGTCHTPRLPDGSLDRSRWLAGAPVPYLPAQANSNWPINAPRIAGTLRHQVIPHRRSRSGVTNASRYLGQSFPARWPKLRDAPESSNSFP